MNANINIINDVLDVFRGVPWYGDCDFCPSNDTKVHNLRVTDGTTIIKPTIGDLDFEELMDCVEKRMGII